MESTAIIGSPKKSKNPPKIYPQVTLRHEFFPEVKDCKVGMMCKIMMEVKVTGLSISRFSNDTEFEIHGFEMMEKNKGKDMSKEKDMEDMPEGE